MIETIAINEKLKGVKNSSLIFLLVFTGLIIIFSFGMGHVAAAPGNVVYVNNSGGQDTNDGSSWLLAKKTIKNATGTINNNGIINIAKGQYTGIKNTQITISKNITINGESKKTTIINGTNTNWIFLINTGAVVTLNKITLSNGIAYNGGAIYNNGTLKVTDSNFLNNTASVWGGAIYNGANLTISGNNFTSNKADYYGGAIFSGENGNLIVSDTKFTGNIATHYDGGAIYCYEGGYLTVDRSNFINNNVGGGGGAIQNYGGTCNINDSIFTGNNAAIWGSSISNSDGSGTYLGTLTVYGSTFTFCTSSSSYGAIYDSGTNCIIIGNNIINNTGYAIYTVNANTQIHFNCILNNTGNHDIWGINGVNATNNWWGTNFNGTSPVIAGRVNNNVNADTWLILNIKSSPTSILMGDNSTVIVDLLHDNNGTIYTPTNGHVPDGIPVYFVTTLGTIISPIKTANGTANSTLNSESLVGSAYITATVDGQSLQTQVIFNNITPTASANPTTGFYNTTKIVKLSMDQAGVIYYTLNGATPTTASTKYTGPITIQSTSTLKYLAVNLAGNKSPIYTNAYTIDKTAPKVASTTPRNNSKGVSLITPIIIKFSENIKKGNNFSRIYLKNMTTGKITHITTKLVDNTITIKMLRSRLSLDSYQVYIPTGAVRDIAGNKNKQYVLNFKTSKY